MGRPIIGITGELEAARWRDWIREAVVSPVTYTRAVERAGGTPVMLPPVPSSSVAMLIAKINGLVITGGRDVDPSLYDEAPHEQTDVPDHRRDRFELILTRAAIDADLPFLAIGRGMHILNVARGGTLIQHLPDRLGNESHKPDPVKLTTHDLEITAASKLGGCSARPPRCPPPITRGSTGSARGSLPWPGPRTRWWKPWSCRATGGASACSGTRRRATTPGCSRPWCGGQDRACPAVGPPR